MTFNLNATVPLSVTNKDSTGTPANASGGAVFTVTAPDGTSTTPAVTAAGSGVYTCTGPSTQSGRYTWTYVSSGTNAAATEDSYWVRASAAYGILSLADARAAVNFSKTINDEELRDYMDAVTAMIERRIGPIIPRAFTQSLSGWSTLSLTYTPVISLTSITTQNIPGQEVILLSDLDVNTATGVVQRYSSLSFGGYPYTVVYQAGRGLDYDVMHAARITLQHIWNNQRPTGGPTRDGDAYTAPFTLPNAAREILDPLTAPSVG